MITWLERPRRVTPALTKRRTRPLHTAPTMGRAQPLTIYKSIPPIRTALISATRLRGMPHTLRPDVSTRDPS